MKSIKEELSDLKYLTSKEYGQESKDHHKNMVMYRLMKALWIVTAASIVLIPLGWIFCRALGWMLYLYTGLTIFCWITSAATLFLVTSDRFNES